ncbi:MAG TPA: PUA domain-containing protein [archaeon]|nr:PUA domain-containing protein [archaeon]
MEKQDSLQKIRSVANYQFGSGAGEALLPKKVTIKFSKKTGKIRFIYLNNDLLATLRARDGMLALTLCGARRLLRKFPRPKFRVVVSNDVVDFIREGRNVFAKHVVEADAEIRPFEEVAVTDGNDKVIAVGRALLTGREMLVFKRGVAVKVRKGLKGDNP